MMGTWDEGERGEAWRVIDEMSFMQLQTLKLLVHGASRDEIARQVGGRWHRAASANLSQFANRRNVGSLARLGYLYRDWELRQPAASQNRETADDDVDRGENAQPQG
jgi:hypothetical protein